MTPALRKLEQLKIAFQLHEYQHDETAEAFGLEAAAKLNLPPERVFKTLVVNADKKLAFAIIPVAEKLSLKKMAAALGAKSAEMADPAEAERATGYVVGGISPLGGRKRIAAVLNQSAMQFETIYLSAGRCGLQVQLKPADLVRAAEAKVADLVWTEAHG